MECYNGAIVELFTFSDVYIKYKDFFINDNIIYVEAEASQQNNDQDSFKVITKKVYHLSQILQALFFLNLKIALLDRNIYLLLEYLFHAY